jgi:hypothetical protein
MNKYGSLRWGICLQTPLNKARFIKNMMIINFRVLLCLSFSFIFSGCFIGGGTHGYIKGYEYPFKRKVVEKNMMAVIKSDSIMYLDTSKPYITVIGNGRVDSVLDNYYYDNINYFTLIVKQGTIEDSYIFRFYGDSTYWTTSTSSEIFICYETTSEITGVYRESNAGSNKKEVKMLTDIFEKRLINEIDKRLHVSHKNKEHLF